MDARRLRVVTLNVWNRSGPWSERLRLIRSELRALAPDVVGLQEVMRLVRPDTFEAVGPEHDQAAEIAEGLGFAIAYAPAADYGNGLCMGNAILSRFPLHETRTHRLPDEGTGEGRSLLYALAGTEWGRLPVFVTHFNWRFEHGFVRLKQAMSVAARVEEYAPRTAGLLPPVLMGDFNAAPEADEIRYLTGLSVQEGRSVHFADAWVYGGDGGPGATFDLRNDYARKNREPSRRIDYIFVRGPDAELRGEPLLTKVVFNKPEPGPEGAIWPSDHFGLYTEIAVEPRSL
ncbi:MAG TPA: endonuclease/exonuclease/phosphatase family protein [Polyangiaceae bacterium]|nr:endonuclease/exonuclease/phosphatase family protein [Polyangiaceae bacterium]